MAAICLGLNVLIECNIDGVMQDYSNSMVIALGLLQDCIKER